MYFTERSLLIPYAPKSFLKQTGIKELQNEQR